MNQDESLTCLELSKNKFSEGDFEGALRLAVKAQRMFESSETNEWLEKVKLSANKASTEEDNSNVRQRQNFKVNEETLPKSPKIHTSSNTKTQTTTSTTNSSELNYSKEQVKEIKEFMKRNKEDYYAVLGIEKSATLDEIKRAYKKLALKFHPDKNQAPGADEAFKMISVAVSVLGDEEKRRNFDRFGVSSNGNSMGRGAGFASPFSSHFGHSAGFEGEISPEELFNMFFNSAFANQQQGFHSSGPGQFFFSTNFQGPQRQQFRTRESRRSSPVNEQEEILKKIIQFLPLIVVFFLSIISSWIFPGENGSKYPSDTSADHLFSFNPSGKYRHSRITRIKQVPYYASEPFQKYFKNLKADDKLSKLAKELASYEGIIENKLIGQLKEKCEQEQRQLAKLLKRTKKDQWDEIIDGFKLKSCEKLKTFE